VICFIPFVIFPGTRFGIGGSDYYIYEQYYSNIEMTDYNYRIEPLFYLIVYIFNWLGFSFNAFLFTVTFASSVLLFYGIKKNTNSIFIGVIIYIGKLYIFYNFVLIRQMIAISIAWFAIAYLRASLKSKFMLLLIIASLFHVSTLVLLPFLFIEKVEISTKNLFLILGVAVIIALCNNLLVSFLINIIPVLGYRLEYYINKENLINPLNYIETFSVLFLTTHYKKELKGKIKNFQLYYNLLIAFTFILIAFYNFEDFKRLRDIFLISYITIIPAIISLSKNKIDKLLIGGICCIYFLLLYVRSIIVFDNNTSIGFLVPYKSILFN
jgi:hypothetical protein